VQQSAHGEASPFCPGSIAFCTALTSPDTIDTVGIKCNLLEIELESAHIWTLCFKNLLTWSDPHAGSPTTRRLMDSIFNSNRGPRPTIRSKKRKKDGRISEIYARGGDNKS
jgi:hypothetical protein